MLLPEQKKAEDLFERAIDWLGEQFTGDSSTPPPLARAYRSCPQIKRNLCNSGGFERCKFISINIRSLSFYYGEYPAYKFASNIIALILGNLKALNFFRAFIRSGNLSFYLKLFNNIQGKSRGLMRSIVLNWQSLKFTSAFL